MILLLLSAAELAEVQVVALVEEPEAKLEGTLPERRLVKGEWRANFLVRASIWWIG